MSLTTVLSNLTADRRSAGYRRRLRKSLDSMAPAAEPMAPFDLEGHADDVLSVLRAFAAGASPVSARRLRLMMSVLKGEAGPAILDLLGHARPDLRRAAAEACGLLQLEIAVPALATMAGDRERRVRLAAVEALGMIGGHRAADALMRALKSRRLPIYRAVIALAKGAPDFYLEATLSDPADHDAVPWLVLALGLRRRSSVRELLLKLVQSDSALTRASACRALGWQATPDDAPLLIECLRDEEGTVREAAARALRRFPTVAVAASAAELVDFQSPSTARVLRALMTRVERATAASRAAELSFANSLEAADAQTRKPILRSAPPTRVLSWIAVPTSKVKR